MMSWPVVMCRFLLLKMVSQAAFRSLRAVALAASSSASAAFFRSALAISASICMRRHHTASWEKASRGVQLYSLWHAPHITTGSMVSVRSHTGAGFSFWISFPTSCPLISLTSWMTHWRSLGIHRLRDSGSCSLARWTEQV